MHKLFRTAAITPEGAIAVARISFFVLYSVLKERSPPVGDRWTVAPVGALLSLALLIRLAGEWGEVSL